jgi:cobaltochelatase CobN
MHLLAAQAGAIQAEGEAIDLAQTPGDIVFAGAADSELVSLAAAADRIGYDGLRLANTMRLANNLSVDLWLDRTVRHARLVVLRLIGGAAYFQYGVDEITALCATRAIPMVLLPGDANPDPILQQRSTVTPETWSRLHALLIAGGPENFDRTLAAFRALAEGQAEPAIAAHSFPKFGYWRPDAGLTNAMLPEPARPVVPVLFYRAVLEGAGTATVSALIARLEIEGLAPLPMAVTSLKDADCATFLRTAFAAAPPSVILNLTGFALGLDELDPVANPFADCDAPVIQLIQSGRTEAQWVADPQGLSARDLAMQMVMPELDGRIGGILVGHKGEAVWHERCQIPLVAYAPDESGIRRAAILAKSWALLRETPRANRRIGVVLANYPLRDGRLANGVGYDAPQSTVQMLRALAKAGYNVDTGLDAAALIERLQAGPTNAQPQRSRSALTLSLSRYRELLKDMPPAIATAATARWGEPEADPFVQDDTFHLPGITLGNVVVLLQPARTHGEDDAASFHDPALPPPHAYLAAYLWLREEWGAHALIHNGKHGTLEWLPGKSTALDAESFPDAIWGHVPHLYPFIVNDPGEGTQAKRRTGAVIIDHLVPPLTRAETYGPLRNLEALLDEYYAAAGMDRRRLADLRRRILDFSRDIRLDRDVTLPDDEAQALIEIDNFLCDLKEAQIRDGLHIFGQSPSGSMEHDLIVALARVPRGAAAGDHSLIRALAGDLRLGFDPLTARLADPWQGPPINGSDAIRTLGDAVEYLEHLATSLVDGSRAPEASWTETAAVLETVDKVIRPRLRHSGPAEMAALIDGLDGKFVRPGPSGAPSRGRLDVLPTGRNFYSVDTRAVPTPTAWELGQKSAENLVLRHLQDHGQHLRAVVISVWGTANMRTGGDDIAQAMALIGARPVWDPGSLRVGGYEIIPLARLGRPRVDVTMRISGFFRDAFPAQIALYDRAIRAIGALDEPEDDNPIAASMRADALGMLGEGQSVDAAGLAAGHRIFGPPPSGYGAGIGKLIDSGNWSNTSELATIALDFAQYAYGAKAHGQAERARLADRLAGIDAVVHNQDNREHDVLDSDNYYQFEGGLALAAEMLSGQRPAIYHNDHSRPDRPAVRTLDEEISRVVRSRVVNPKWIAGVMRHGYRGAFEIVATVDFMFGFAATTGAVKTHHFDLAFEAYIEDDAVREFLQASNRHGYRELIAKFTEARQRGYWTPRSNAAFAFLEDNK